MTLAVFDANKGLKISEDFHVDLNSPFLRQMVPPPSGLTDSGPHPLSEKATRALVVRSLISDTWDIFQLLIVCSSLLLMGCFSQKFKSPLSVNCS